MVGFRLMCENGYQKTTTADIAKAAGVSTGIIYSYFKDKHDIFTAGLELNGSQMIMPMYDQFTFPLDIRKSGIFSRKSAGKNTYYLQHDRVPLP